MNHINLIRKLAWNFHRSTGVDFKELFCEASLKYCEILRTYDKEKGALPAYAWTAITNRLIHFVRIEKRYQTVDTTVFFNTSYIQETFFQSDIYETLPEDCKTIIQKIFDILKENDEYPISLLLWKVKTILTEEGWTHRRTQQNINILRKTFGNDNQRRRTSCKSRG